MEASTYNCGHPRTPENSKGTDSRWPGCRTCAQERDRLRKRGRIRHRGCKPTGINVRDYSLIAHLDPVLGRNDSVDQLPVACKALLKAIYREHPYVFDAAERSGRMVVRP